MHPKRIRPIIFPGVDPWIEGSSKWKGFHQSLLIGIARHLEASLPDGYSADPEEAVNITQTGPGGITDRRTFYPDAAVSSDGGAAVLDAPRISVDGETEGEYADTEDVDGVMVCSNGKLVTWIEVVSPKNKTKSGIIPFVDKRKWLVAAGINLVTLDVIRGGERLFSSPIADHTVSWHRRGEPRPRVIGFGVKDAIPDVVVPLETADYVMDMATLYRDTWIGHNLGNKLSYAVQDLRPRMPAADLAWAMERVADAKR